jgi:mycothiol synthase
MGFTRFAGLEPPQVPPGYNLRTYRAGDEEAWLEMLSAGEFGVWDRSRLDRLLAGERAPMPRKGIFFITQEDRPVGTASTFLYNGEQGEQSELGWVAVHPQHRGHGLARQVCLAMLGFARDLGHAYTFLKTEEFRLAAIKTYLRLGFEPEMTDPRSPAQWEALRRALSVETKNPLSVARKEIT